MNLYEYAGSDPVNATDSSGLAVNCNMSIQGCPALSLCGDSLVCSGEFDIPLPSRNRPCQTGCDLPHNYSVSAGGGGSNGWGANFASIGGGGVVRRQRGCTGAGNSAASFAIDRVNDAHTSIYVGGSKGLTLAGNSIDAEKLAAAGRYSTYSLAVVSESIAAAQDHANGMSWARAALIHSGGALGGVAGAEGGAALGFAAGEAIFPEGGGLPVAIYGGIGGSLGGQAWGEKEMEGFANSVGVCR